MSEVSSSPSHATAAAASGAPPAPGLAPLIEVRGLSRAYGSFWAVQDVSFSVGRGEIVGFLGPNGAGKSTTLRMLVGFLGPSAGSVRINGFDVVEQPLLARQSLGYMPEAAPLYPELRVREYLSFRARLKHVPSGQVSTQLEQVAAKAGITDVMSALIGTLSRGYRQRVALADALLNSPPLLILDEPTAGLDPNQIHSVRNVIRELGASHTVLLSTHILSEVESICTRALVIDRGALVAQGSIAELRRRRGQQRALLTLVGASRQALGQLLSAAQVASVVPAGARPSRLPAAAAGAELPAAAELEAAAGPEGALSLLIGFEPGADAGARLEDLVALLVRAGARVREARLEQSSLEDVFRQLTGADLGAA